jgi:hypothetical protein
MLRKFVGFGRVWWPIVSLVGALMLPSTAAYCMEALFTIPGMAPGTQNFIDIRMYADHGNIDYYKSVSITSPTTHDEVMNTFINDLTIDHGFTASRRGENLIVVTGVLGSTGYQLTVSHEHEIAMGVGIAMQKADYPSGCRIFEFYTTAWTGGWTDGTQYLSINGTTVSALLQTSESILLDAELLASALSNAGFQVSRDGILVHIDWDDPVNAEKIGQQADVNFWTTGGGDNRGARMGMVGTCGSGPIPTLSEWAMILFSVLLLGLMTYYVIKCRRMAHSVAV